MPHKFIEQHAHSKSNDNITIYIHDSAERFMLKHKGEFNFNVEKKILDETKKYLLGVKTNTKILRQEIKVKWFDDKIEIELLILRLSASLRAIVTCDYDELFSEYHLVIFDICNHESYKKSCEKALNYLASGSEKEIIWQ